MDLFGLEPLCDEISHKKVESAIGADSTAANDLGPFWRPNAPRYPMGASVVQTPDNLNWQGRHTNYHGRVLNAATGQPIESAELDVWQAAPNGLYDVQDPSQPDMNLRGRFTTGKDGEYSFYALRPTAYSAPSEGPWADMLKQLDRHFVSSYSMLCADQPWIYSPSSMQLTMLPREQC